MKRLCALLRDRHALPAVRARAPIPLTLVSFVRLFTALFPTNGCDPPMSGMNSICGQRTDPKKTVKSN